MKKLIGLITIIMIAFNLNAQVVTKNNSLIGSCKFVDTYVGDLKLSNITDVTFDINTMYISNIMYTYAVQIQFKVEKINDRQFLYVGYANNSRYEVFVSGNYVICIQEFPPIGAVITYQNNVR